MKDSRLFYLFSIIYRILLDAIYLTLIAPYFAYDGLGRNIIATEYILSWILFLMFARITIPFLTKGHNITSNLAILLFLMKIVPLTSYIACNAQPLHFILLQTIYFSLILLLFNALPPIQAIAMKSQNVFVDIIAFVFIATIVFLSWNFTHFRLNFSLKNVYDLRLSARQFDIPIILEYIHSAAVKVLPVLFIYYIEKRNKVMSGIIILALLLSFGIDGMKSTFFNLILCIGCYFIFRHSKRILPILPMVFTILCVIAYGEYVFIHSDSIAHIIIRRMFFIPSHLDTLYYQYTLDSSPLYFRSNIDGVDISFVIGELWRTMETRANNGLFSDAFANLGTAGVFIYPIIYTIFFKWADSVFQGKDQGVTFYAAFIIAYNLIGSFFSVCLLTHGMFILCLTVLFMPQAQKTIKSI